MSFVVGHELFPHLSANNDEAVYVLEAQTLASGHLTLSSTAHGDAFRPWMSGRVNDHLVLVEQPVLPALMAASDQLFGTMRVALAAVAAAAVLAIFAMTRQLVGDDRVALVAAGCFALSPLVIVQSGLYLSYLLAVALDALVLLLVDRALERSSRRLLLLAGLLYGLLFFTRPLDSLLLALVIAVWFVHRRLGWRITARRLLTMAAGALPVISLSAGYNLATTGKPWRFPLWVIGGNDAFGFGDRTIAEGGPPIHVGPGQAWLALRANLRAFPHWFLGGLLCLPLFAWGAYLAWQRHRRAFVATVAIAVIFPAGYFFYYGNYLVLGGRDMYGPHYYLSLLVPASVLFALGVSDLWARRRHAAALLIPLLLIGTAIEVPDKIRRNTDIRDTTDGELAAVRASVHSPAVVILPASLDGAYVLHPRGALGNPPDLDAPVLYAADLGARNRQLFDRYPDRRIYRLQVISGYPVAHPDVSQLTLERGSTETVDVDADPPTSAPTTAYVTIDDATVTCAARSGWQHLAVVIGRGSVALDGCNSSQPSFALSSGPMTIAVGVEGVPDGPGTRTAEARYDVCPVGNEIDVLAPADIWTRDDSQPFVVADATELSWIHASVHAN